MLKNILRSRVSTHRNIVNKQNIKRKYIRSYEKISYLKLDQMAKSAVRLAIPL